MKRNILDQNLSEKWGHHVFNDAEIIWEGAPKFKKYFPSLDNRIGVFEYAFTKEKILIKSTRWIFPKVYSIHFNKIHKITYEYYPDGSGTIYFMTVNKPEFKSHDLQKGSDRFYPTFEYIPRVDEVYPLVCSCWEEYTLQYGTESPKPVVEAQPADEHLLKWGKRLVYLIAVLYTLYAVDFFLLPMKTTQDIVEVSESSYYGREYLQSEISRKGIYHTQQNLNFSTQDNVYNFSGQALSIKYSPVFKSVKEVTLANGRSISHSLSNDFNGAPSFLHWGAMFFILGSALRIGTAKHWREDVFIESAVAVFCGFLLSCWMWYSYS
jgi:hypothetical protein